MSFPFTFPHYFPGEPAEVPDVPSWSGIDYDGEILAQAYGRLLYQYQGKPRMEALLAAFMQRLQDAHKATWDVLTLTSIETATGAQLDRLGLIVGESRRDRDDDIYRRWIRARVRTNRSDGRVVDFYAILALVFPESDARLFDRFPNAVEVILDGAVGALAEDTNRLVQSARAAGHRVEFLYTESAVADSLLLGSTVDAGLGGSLGSTVSGAGDDLGGVKG